MTVRRLLTAVVAVLALVGGLAVPVALPARVAGASVPPGFDNGNQTVSPLTRRIANENFSSLSSVATSSASIVATDDVVGPHGPNDPAALQAFRGLSETEHGASPPDTQLAVGDNFVVEAVNNTMEVFDRKGSVIRAVSLESLFGLGGVSDPKVVFDLQASRWYVSIMDTSSGADAGDAVDIAVSHSSDPTGQWDVYRMFTAASDRFADQPRLGFSADKVIVEFSNQDKLNFPSFCLTCWDDIMIVIEKSDLTSLASNPQAVDINMSTELNHRQAIIPSIPLPSAEVPDAYAVYRGHDAFGAYASTLVIVGLPSTNDVAFKETGPKVNDTGTPPAASQPGVTPANLDAGQDDRMLSVSLVSASTTDFSAVLWAANATHCKPSGSSIDRACARIDKIVVDASGSATVAQDFDLGLNGSDIMYPAVMGDVSGNRVWVADTRSGPVFPTSELRLITFGGGTPVMKTISYGTGSAAYTIDMDAGHKNLTRFGDYSGIYVDPSETSGGTVWAATENAAVGAGQGWTTSIVEATFLPPDPIVMPNSGNAGDIVDVVGQDFSRDSVVTFGAFASTEVTFLASDHLRVRVPAQSPTTVDVQVTTLKGTSVPVLSDRFTYGYLLWFSGFDSGGFGSNLVAIDPTTDTRHLSVDTGAGRTQGIALTPDGSQVFATSPTTSTLSWADADGPLVGGTKKVGVSPTEIAISSDGNTAFVTDPGAFKGAGGVIVLKLNTSNGVPSVLTTVPVSDPRGVATTSNGQAWVTSGSGQQVVGLTTIPCPIIKRWCPTFFLPTVGASPGPITASADHVWVGAAGAVGNSPGLVYSIDPTSPALSPPIFIDRVPTAMAVTPSGQWVFVVAGAAGVEIPILHAPPSPDSALPEVSLPDTPPGGAAVSFDSARLFVAGGVATGSNELAVPSLFLTTLTSGADQPAELATDLPPKADCGGGSWGPAHSSRTVNQTVPTAGAIVTVTASVLYCPPPLGLPGTATLSMAIRPPKGCAKAYRIDQPLVPLVGGVVTFVAQLQATCSGHWSATPRIRNYTGGGSAPPSFKSSSVNVS